MHGCTVSARQRTLSEVTTEGVFFCLVMVVTTCRCITRLDDSDEALSMAISVVFEWLCIDTDIDVERDREEIIRYDGKYIEGVCKTVSKADFSLSM